MIRLKTANNIDEHYKLNIMQYASNCKYTVNEDATLADVALMMKTHNVRHIPVKKSGYPVGIISARDIQASLNEKECYKLTVSDFMQKDPYIVSGDVDIDDVLEVLIEKKYGCVLIMDKDNRNISILTTIDIMRAFQDILRFDVTEMWNDEDYDLLDEEMIDLDAIDVNKDMARIYYE